MQRAGLALLTLALALSPASAAELTFKERLLGELVKQVPGILDSFDPKTGRFGSGIWICMDQNAMYPLAAAYASPGAGNPFHNDPELLQTIMKAGDALIDDMDAEGCWVFRKKDGSTWGNIRMPWTYSRWIRTFQLIRDRMPPERRQRWAKALALGYSKIAQRDLGHVHNIPAHHAMGLYAAGKALDRPEWCAQAAEFLAKVAAQQAEAGYWSEGGGPVIEYNFVYVEALGTYLAMSGDCRVLAALEKAAAFHRRFTYPGGQNVETLDQRNPYHDRIAPGNVGFTFSPVGRAYLANQWSRLGKTGLDADLIASLVLFGQEGPLAEAAPAGDETFVLREGGADRAATVRRGPWFLCLSAYTTPVVKSRWIQDRQNLLSVYHDKTGLIVGGGNTKLQPLWSNFTVGDPALLAHRPGDTNPDFLPKGELFHVPSAATLLLRPDPTLRLTYGPEPCTIRAHIQDDRTLRCTIGASGASELPVKANLTLIPRFGKPLQTAAGQTLTLGRQPIALGAEQVGAWVAHGGYRLKLPPGATLTWPALPHNPYRADGHATPEEGRIVIQIPLQRGRSEGEVTIEIVDG